MDFSFSRCGVSGASRIIVILGLGASGPDIFVLGSGR
jgi:hypothetical protein